MHCVYEGRGKNEDDLVGREGDVLDEDNYNQIHAREEVVDHYQEGANDLLGVDLRHVDG